MTYAVVELDLGQYCHKSHYKDRNDHRMHIKEAKTENTTAKRQKLKTATTLASRRSDNCRPERWVERDGENGFFVAMSQTPRISQRADLIGIRLGFYEHLDTCLFSLEDCVTRSLV